MRPLEALHTVFLKTVPHRHFHDLSEILFIPVKRGVGKMVGEVLRTRFCVYDVARAQAHKVE